MPDRFTFPLALAVAALLAATSPAASGWTDLGHGLALDPSGRLVELALLLDCQQLATEQAVGSW